MDNARHMIRSYGVFLLYDKELEREDFFMEQTSKRTAASIVAMIAFVVTIFIQLIQMIYNASYYGRYTNFLHVANKIQIFKRIYLPYLLLIVPLVLLVVAMIIGKKNILLVVSTGLMTIAHTISLITNIRSGYYRIVDRSTISSGKLTTKFSLIFMAPDLLEVFSWFAITLFAVVLVFNVSTTMKELLKKIWFIPGLLGFVQIVFSVIVQFLEMGRRISGFYVTYYWMYSVGMRVFINIIINSFVLIGLLLLGRWFAYPLGKGKKILVTNADGTTSYETVYASEEDGYISMAMHVLLLIFFGGIWQYIWIYRTTKHLNCVKDEQYRNPTTKLLLCMFIPFYYIYWIYVSAKRIDKLAREKGLQSDIATLSLLMQFILPIVSPILMQDKINAASKVKQPEVQPMAEPAMQPAPQSVEVQEKATDANASIPELLKQYKELLDSGIITEEEYEAKKKQLLGL